MSYLDNLCFMADRRLPRFWLRAGRKRSVFREYAPWLGERVADTLVEALTTLQQLDLVYARILLMRPRVVLCAQPFMQGDVQQRMHIWSLLERLLDRGISVVILAVNLADTLSLADRLVCLEGGRVSAEYGREAFGALPENTPWRHLWPEGPAAAIRW